MIRAARVAPTRINLLAARRRLGQVQRGAALVRRKRDALVRELFRLARPAADLRAGIMLEFVEAYDALLAAFALFSKILPFFAQANLHWIVLLLPIHLALAFALARRERVHAGSR